MCGNLQMCEGLEADIKVATHAVGQRRMERKIVRRQEGEEAGDSDEEEESGGVEAEMGNLRIETAVTVEEEAEELKHALDMEVEELGEGEEWGEGTQRALGALDFLTQDAEPSGTTLVDACNWFNKLSRLEILWTVWYRWPAGARFAFNFYRADGEQENTACSNLQLFPVLEAGIEGYAHTV